MNAYGFHRPISHWLQVLSACGGLKELECGRVSHGSAVKYGSQELYLRVCVRGGGSNFGWNGETDSDLPNKQGKQVHGFTIKLGFEGDLHLCNSLLDMYAKNGDMESAEVLFGSLSETSTVSWNVMISGFGQNHDKERAMQYMERMRALDVEPDEVTYINMLAACVKSGILKWPADIFEIAWLAPSLISWNAILSGYSQNEEHLEALKLFREMQFQNQRPDRTTLAIILSLCSEMGFLECGVQSLWAGRPGASDIQLNAATIWASHLLIITLA
ncbi:hypothetical protein HAX54_005835 [Datura stramonium]|uniref:Pentatricopeptide repeat-containing protein n=1 Tax=Datura stramonium TaxID=4076 RepID=A0ABS8TAU0_DATST|nr:hypothetical protein [Datura stramonium]